jgi:hypothetical protein
MITKCRGVVAVIYWSKMCTEKFWVRDFSFSEIQQTFDNHDKIYAQ